MINLHKLNKIEQMCKMPKMVFICMEKGIFICQKESIIIFLSFSYLGSNPNSIKMYYLFNIYNIYYLCTKIK